MSILINGMEMPKEPLMLILFPDGHISTEEYDIGANAFATAIPSNAQWIDVTNFTPEESELYWKAIKTHSIPTGISIDDLMEMKE